MREEESERCSTAEVLSGCVELAHDPLAPQRECATCDALARNKVKKGGERAAEGNAPGTSRLAEGRGGGWVVVDVGGRSVVWVVQQRDP